MNILRPKSILRLSGALRPVAVASPRSGLQVRFATQDYGSGDGNPAGEKPQEQGQNPSEKLEHPGPPPPSVAKGQSSSSPNNDDAASSSSSSSNTSSSSSSSKEPSNKREFSTSTRRRANEEPAVKQGQENKPKASEIKGAQPKILNENPPSAEEESGDVKKHNEQMSQRAEQAHEKVSNEDAYKDKTGAK